MPDAGTPNSAPRRSAAAGSMSATALTSRTGNAFAAVRYCPLILPQPMMPMPTRRKPHPLRSGSLEATTGIEPVCTDLQSAA